MTPFGSYEVVSRDIHPYGLQIETEAPIFNRMAVKLWPQDYGQNPHAAHGKKRWHAVPGEIRWLKPLHANKFRCGIVFQQKTNWPVPLNAFEKLFYSVVHTDESSLPADFVQDSIADGVFGADHKWRTTSFAEDDETAGLQLHKPLTLVEIEKRAIYNSLKRNQWKRMATCRELGISKDTLCRKITLHNINSQDDDLI